MKDLATKCVDDIETRLKTMAGMSKRVFHIYSEDDLMDITKGLVFPCMGVVYNGIRAIPEAGSTGKQGGSGELVITVMLFFRDESKAANSLKLSATELLDDVRDAIMGTRSPSGHFWRFQLEAPVEGKKNVLSYVQRWSTPVQLV